MTSTPTRDEDHPNPTPPTTETGDAVRSAAGHAYRPHLDGIRALAVVAVICFHLGYGWIPGGFVGVDVFFVLSGYLITGILLAELTDRSSLRLGRFYARRARRLLPASIAVLVVVAIVGLGVLDLVQQRSLGWDTTFAALYSANWRFAYVGGDYFAPGDVPSPLVHYWSLAVEEQFYLVWPAALVVLHRLARRWRGDRWQGPVALGIAVLAAASLLASLVLTGRPSAYYGTHTRAYQLLAGALLAAILCWRPVRPRASTANAALAGAAALASLVGLGVLAHTTPDAVDYPGARALAVTALSLVLLAAVDLVPRGPAARLFGLRPAAAVGRLSYSLYIWHWPIIVLLPLLADTHGWPAAFREPPVLVAATVVVAGLSYLAVERPVRFRLAPRARPLPVVTTGLAASVVVAVAAYPLFQPTSSFERRALDSVNDIAPSEPCAYARVDWPRDAADARPCVSRSGAADAPVIAIVGDSHAQAWTPAIEAAAARADATVIRVTRRACTPVDVTPTLRGETNQVVAERDCTDWRRAVFPKLIAEHDPDLVIVVNRSHVRSIEAEGVRYDVGDEGHLQAWTQGWDWTIDALAEGGADVVVATILPTLPWRMPACLADAGRDDGSCDVPVADDADVVPFNDAIQALDGTRDGQVRVLDPTSIPCPDGVCRAMIDGTIVFRDDNHLTATFASERAEAFTAALAAIGITL